MIEKSHEVPERKAAVMHEYLIPIVLTAALIGLNPAITYALRAKRALQFTAEGVANWIGVASASVWIDAGRRGALVEP